MKRFSLFALPVFVLFFMFSVFITESFTDIYTLDDNLSEADLSNDTKSIIDVNNDDVSFDFGDSVVSNDNVVFCKMLYDFNSIPQITAS